MNLVQKIMARALSLLLVAALAIGPVVVVAQAESMSVGEHAAVMDESVPCDMPCDGCDMGGPSLSCVMTCAGFVASIAATDVPPGPSIAADRVSPVLQRQLDGREREPDKPPPKLVLA
jgi:hypothetical protein